MSKASNFTVVDDEFMNQFKDIVGTPEEQAERDAARDEMNRVHAANLAAIRKAGELTQVELAKRMGVGQGSISRLESRNDMLLSTLFDYLTATGAENAQLSVTVRGQRIELDLAGLNS